jgi:hypothetical protein
MSSRDGTGAIHSNGGVLGFIRSVQRVLDRGGGRTANSVVRFATPAIQIRRAASALVGSEAPPNHGRVYYVHVLQIPK